ncbi:MAG: ankyrin repeat domain-containing protein [Myxococcales bacterium]|nr:ankyrin repeat domain-containing protein [Myxococcales bacterium]
MKKKILIVLGVLLAGAVVWFIFHGRYWVEGGHAPWAVINKRPDVLRQAIADGASKKSLRLALARAVGRGDLVSLKLLLDAKVSPDPRRKGFCHAHSAIYFGRLEVTRALLEAGADVRLCGKAKEMMRDAIDRGYRAVPQGTLIAIIAQLHKRGLPIDPRAIEAAERHKLERVAAFLRNPEAASAAAASKAPAGAASLGKPGSVSKDDLRGVCAGKAVPTAAPYKKQRAFAAKLFYFRKHFDKWRWPGTGPGAPSLPRWWFSFKELANTQLVACVDGTDHKTAERCRYRGGSVIEKLAVNYVVTLYEAKTAKKVASHKFTPPVDERCSLIKFGKDSRYAYPRIGKALRAFLAPHVGGPQ